MPIISLCSSSDSDSCAAAAGAAGAAAALGITFTGSGSRSTGAASSSPMRSGVRSRLGTDSQVWTQASMSFFDFLRPSEFNEKSLSKLI